eukprot:scaffold36942_cov50-Phaeocystis_antarctica.AAC.4
MEHAPTVPRLARRITLLAVGLRLSVDARKREVELAGQDTQLLLGNEVFTCRRLGDRTANPSPRNHSRLVLGTVTALAAVARLALCWHP